MAIDLQPFAAHIRPSSTSPGRRTEQIYVLAAARFLEMLGGELGRITAASLVDFRDCMHARALAPATMRVYMAGVRRFCEWLSAQGHALPEFARPRLPQLKSKAPPWVSDTDMGRVRAYVGTEVPEPYATCLLMLPLTGLRVSEACRLQMGQLDWDGDQYVLRNVAGKSKAERHVFLLRDATPFMDAYLVARGRLTWYDPQSPWLFLGPQNAPIGRKAVARRLRQVRSALQISGLTPHACRHYWATKAHAAGVSLKQIQEHLGHESIETTSLYIHLQPSQTKEALGAVAADWLHKEDDGTT